MGPVVSTDDYLGQLAVTHSGEAAGIAQGQGNCPTLLICQGPYFNLTQRFLIPFRDRLRLPHHPIVVLAYG